MNITNYIFGDIVLGEFTFTDKSASKKRPMLILTREEDDYLVAFISSKDDIRSKGDIPIIKDTTNNLIKDGIIRTRKITMLHEDLIYKKIGELTKNDQENIRAVIADFFSNV